MFFSLSANGFRPISKWEALGFALRGIRNEGGQGTQGANLRPNLHSIKVVSIRINAFYY
jgi:hypothetical protein